MALILALNTLIALVLGYFVYRFYFNGKKQTVKQVDIKERGVKQASAGCDGNTEPITSKEVVSVVTKTEQHVGSSLAEYDATVATSAMVSNNYIKEHFPVKKIITPFLDDLVAEMDAVLRDSVKKEEPKIAEKANNTREIKKNQVSKVEKKEISKEIDVESLGIASAPVPVQTKQPKAEPKPFLAAYNATEALCKLEAQHFVEAMPKAPQPCLEAFNATEAICKLEAQQYIAVMPKQPKPCLEAYNATEAICKLEAQQYIAAMPKQPKPCLKAFNATEAICKLEAQQYIAAMPKQPRPFLAAFNSTEAMCKLEAQQYITTMPKQPKPCLEAYNATEALCKLEAQQYIAAMPKQPKPFLAAFNSTEAVCKLEAQQFIKQLFPEKKRTEQVVSVDREIKGLKSDVETCAQPCLAAYDATTASVALAAQQYIENTHAENQQTKGMSTKEVQKEASDSDVELEIEEEIESPATTPSSSTTSLDLPVWKNSTLSTNAQPYFASTPWMPGQPFVFEPYAVGSEKKVWTREQKIEKQIQSHMPKMKNRCDYWPNCTNKHCKYSHPVIPCKVGDNCLFGKRCSFIHPEDYLEPVKKRPTTQGNKDYKKPNHPRSTSYNAKHHTPKAKTLVRSNTGF